MNSINLVGRLARDPETKTTATGKNVTEISIGVSRKIKAQDGTDTDWFRVKCWGGTGEFVHKYLTRGRLVSVTGRIEVRKYTDSSGNQREAHEVIADSVQGLDKPKDGQSSTGSAKPYDAFSDEEYA